MPLQQFVHEQSERTATLQQSLRQLFDPFGLVATSLKAQQAWLAHPDELAEVLGDYANGATKWAGFALRRWWGEEDTDVFPPNPEDTRFADPVWRDSPYWDSIKEWYLFNTHWLQDTLYATPGMCCQEQSRTAFWLRQWLNAVAPTNFLPLNPVAIANALATNGDSLTRGLQNFARDAMRGDISMTDLDAFTVGKNLATTPGAVVYRGRLLEVIHYEATTPDVHAVPLVIVSPWINKYYILDLNEKKSLIRYLVDQGFSVFVTSWKNPGSEDRGLSFDDYLQDGVAQIIDVARSISGSDKVNLVGYCIGGTLVSAYLAWANRKTPGQVPVNSATLLTTLTDFERPGDIEVFIDEEGLAFIEKQMERKGYLDGKEMASSFRMLRANSLIWNYWVDNYLMGNTPMAFDVLYWNMDTTRMPETMHRYYLRELYLRNRLVEPDALTMAGEPIDLGRIEQPLYLVSTEEDHIAPWLQTWKLIDRVAAPVTFTLSTSGHILGIINPPSPSSKRSYWQGVPDKGVAGEAWLAGQQKVAGSWWPSWVEWLRPQSGDPVKPKLSNRQYPRHGDAPGQYVLE
ncbi:PHA/PHB synthase family protein [Chitinilyticum litopenaei]|uniref:PHA/PHB synthase family protein n=1 Tax=Chitinilyticum litopenaei TaxID=1121276 RepID=UPI00041B5775|nr:alpha/beta fold hydrolase [Chitinilyticum litopenaei]